MYCRIIPALLPKVFIVKEKSKNEISVYHSKLLKFLSKFVSEFNEYVKQKKSYGFKDRKDIELHRRYLEYYKKLNKFIEIVNVIKIENLTINEYFKRSHRFKRVEADSSIWKRKLITYWKKNS